MKNLRLWVQTILIITSSVIGLSTKAAIAQITADTTLPNNSQVNPIDQNNVITIEGGSLSSNKNNLFHSFKDFSVLPGTTARFNNIESVQNIIVRITGNNISDIEGTIKSQYAANLFLINPNGIIFGSNASLQIGGSFIASTANSLNFADGTKFSATDSTTPLLTVSVPIGLQFGATAAPIRNQSQASNPDGMTNISGNPVGLEVKPGKTLALIGGDIILEGGNLTAASGRIELGSVAANNFVSLDLTNQDWIVGYEKVDKFQNIQFIERTINGVDIGSEVDASGEGGGSIQVQGKTVELAGDGVLLSIQTTGGRNGKDLTINSKDLIVRDGAQISTATAGVGNGGNLFVNASESVEVIGSSPFPNSNNVITSALFTSTAAGGKAGDLVITTKILRIEDGAQVSTASDGIGTLVGEGEFQIIPATGRGGDLTIDASEAVEITGFSKYKADTVSSLVASTNGSGDAGNVTIITGKLTVSDHAVIGVNSQFSNFSYVGGLPKLGRAGQLNVNAQSIFLNDKAQLTSENQSGQGGNITLLVQNLLLMRRNSQITTNAGTAQAGGDGGSITIDAPSGFLVTVPSENNDITANAFSGSGGKVTINAKSIFGFVPRTRADLVRLLNTSDPEQLNPSNLPTSDITAFSQQSPSLNGTVQINSPDADPSKGLVQLPVNLVDASHQIVADCNSGGKTGRSSFIATGRGGVIADPTQPLISDDAVIADWIILSPESKNRAEGRNNRVFVHKQRNTEEKSQKVNSVNVPTEIVEAQGWVIDANGNVVLVAQAPNARPNSPALAPASCAAH